MFPKPKRIEDRKLLDTYHSMKCMACPARSSDPAHIKSKGSGGDDVPENLMPLCRIHHTEQHKIGWYRFALKHPPVLFDLKKKGWGFDQVKALIRVN